MHIIYYDVGGTHSVAVASALHLNKLSMDIKPSKEDILSLPTFDKVTGYQLGHLIYQGEDELGNQVYTIGCKYYKKIVMAAVIDVYKLNGNLQDLKLVDTKPTINFIMKVGGFASRALGIVSIGRPIVTFGVLRAYPQLVELVREVKRGLAMQ